MTTQFTYDRQADPVVIPKPTLDLILGTEKPVQVLAVFAFVWHTAKWQHTEAPRAALRYIAQGLKMDRECVQRTVKTLMGLSLLKRTTRKDDRGRIVGHFLEVRNEWKGRKEGSPQAGFPTSGRTGYKCLKNSIERDKGGTAVPPLSLKSKKEKRDYPAEAEEVLAQFLTARKEQAPQVYTEAFISRTREGALSALDALHRIDGLAWDTIRSVLAWAVKDRFWARNLLSLASLRQKGKGGATKFETLLAQSAGEVAVEGEEPRNDKLAEFLWKERTGLSKRESGLVSARIHAMWQKLPKETKALMPWDFVAIRFAEFWDSRSLFERTEYSHQGMKGFLPGGRAFGPFAYFLQRYYGTPIKWA